MKIAWIPLGVLICVVWPATASDVKVIANSSVKASEVSGADLKGVFLTTKTSLADGDHVQPVLLKSGGTHDAFVKQYIGRTTMALESYYRSLVFTGKGTMPKVLASDEAMVAYVGRTKGAIGYVSAAANSDGVKILEVK
jgi:ABC-type phosphate transport system substrate-binding protein